MKEWHARSQLLLGVNDLAAARRMKLEAHPFVAAGPAPTVAEFLSWAKYELLAGHVPIIGVFNNVTRLGEPKSLADPIYDHIVPLLAIDSVAPPNPFTGYDSKDKLTLSDNGLFGRRGHHPFLFTYRFGNFAKTRRQADAPNGPLYSEKATPPNYGTSITGIRDPEGVTVPVHLSSSSRGEGARNRPRLKHRPRGSKIQLTARAKLPDRHAAYDVYLYRAFRDVPTRDFNAHAAAAVRHWHIPAGHPTRWTKRIRTSSGATRVFRAVRSSAP